MASVALRTVVFNLASDPSQVLVIDWVTQINPAPQTPGEDRMYGTGRYRALTAGTRQQTVALAFAGCDPATVAQLEAWDGVLLCYRDDSGRKFFGTYRSPQITRHSYNADADVSLTFTETTYFEAV